MAFASEWKPRRPAATPSAFDSNADLLTQHFGRLVSQTLRSRGIEDLADAETFLKPRLDQLGSPFRLKNLKEAAERVAFAIERKEAIAVYADYDMDGMSALALLVSFFEACGAEKVRAFQPDRLTDGYGVHADAIIALATEGVKVIVTVDTGISAFDAAVAAKTHGVDLIITDHHLQVGDALPDTPHIVNPNQRADSSGLTYLSGVGVAFYLALAVRHHLRAHGHFTGRTEPDLRQWLDFYALGTIADIVDLKEDNRILLRAALHHLHRSPRAGLRALLDRCLPPNTMQLTVRDVEFSLTPKLNAASRMGKAELSTELLLCTDPLRAEALVDEILALNAKRSALQAQIVGEAAAQAEAQIAEHKAPVLVVNGAWHEGVLGVVAAKLVEQFGRPSIVLAKTNNKEHTALLRGSMRTQAHFSCVRALEGCAEALIKYGGHRMAAGLQLHADKLEAFREMLWAKARTFLESQVVAENVLFDGDLPNSPTIAEIESLEQLSPCGQGNPEPLFLLQEVELRGAQTLKSQHIKCRLPNGSEAIGFFMAERIATLVSEGCTHADLLVTPEINRFQNRKTIQFRFKHVRPSQRNSTLS